MKKFEYKSKINGESVILSERLSEEEMDERQLQRVWSLGFKIKTVDWGH